MRDRDDIDMQAWARRAFEGEPAAGSLGDTTRADLDRAHAGLSRRRRWTAGFSAVAVAGVVTAIAVVPSLSGGLPGATGGNGPASNGSDKRAETDRSDDAAPDLSPADQALLDQCEPLATQAAAEVVTRTASSAADEGYDSRKPSQDSEPRVSLEGWTVVDRMDDSWGTTAILLDPDGGRWAECTVGTQAGFFDRAVRTPSEVPRGFVEQPDGTYEWQGGDSVSWAQRCIKTNGPSDCGRDLYFMTTRLPAGVESISVRTYDGAESQARVTDGFVLWRTFGPVLNDYDGQLLGSSSQPPVILTYRSADGDVLSRYDANFLPPIPDGACEGPGGC
jgi:hypothetical protein